ncbi:tRNA pseudouridine(55) synthase TruB [Adlercreutzia sp. ZJ141]|uniref:tRNA pseudouridine(55) synthase TruB n=1 Tax=Adlercreutzia sp. ZJ141 TaxID=2709406 RepID=UPI0013ED442C|nr:tRNA pseudouridine(55) synthase TruB [Adlercreutzia sp. ZJ141]
MKRGQSGHCFVLGIDKPSGMSSHDVVNACRRAFSERRVGHTGTLDPLASGVLPICVGAATRLDQYLTGHDKTYEVDIRFGVGTDTDDAAGNVVKRGVPARALFDENVAETYLHSIVGPQKQLPPAYSAIKVQGKRAYAAAREGTIIDLAPRDIVVRDARLMSITEAPDSFDPVWTVLFSVSKGTYIRSLARDAGIALGCPAHVAALRRIRCGNVGLDDCMQLDALGSVEPVLLDPIKMLGFRFVFCSENLSAKVASGMSMRCDAVELFEYSRVTTMLGCACTSGVVASCEPLHDGERICMIADNRLKAIYRYDATRRGLRPDCVFQVGVQRG